MTGCAGGTFNHEQELPRVPLPSLEGSCERFLSWCAPLLSPEEMAATEGGVESFLRPDSAAHTLQRALQEYDASEGVHSWLDDFWPSRYLGRRDRIALNANFFFLLQDTGQGQVERAAGLIAAAVDFKLALDEERVAPVVQQGRALSMEQTKSLFSATRIPGPVQDTVRVPYSDDWPGPSRARHVIVFRRGHLFGLDVIDPQGRPYAATELEAALSDVLGSAATSAPPGTSVGHLTTLARAEWATRRQRLLECHPGNAASLDVVETALFVVCLEDGVPADAHEACDSLLHGNSANRWFDKSLSWIVFPDGTAGLNVEHCNLDGTTVLNLVDAMAVRRADARAPDGPAQQRPAVRPVELVLAADLQRDVRAAGEDFAAYAGDTVTSVLSFEDFGVQSIKQLRMSPDAFVQMAYQVSHHRSRGHVGATYESIATRHFLHGRTEAMRVVTPQVLAFVAAMIDEDSDDATRRAAMRAAADAHVERAQQCRGGQAPEQHLWELQLLQQRRGAELGATEPLALYETPGWRRMRADYLSTSSAPSPNISYFGFGSTSASCIGVAYVLLADRFNVYLSAPRQLTAELHAFADELRRAVLELQALLADGGE
ncbi:MAG TPA: choline/carnitine O-acyltransferase [Nocardioidaceae bacterium]|nr:choline/carnitine O-acyltransferase [Nocardioidaceae bacterium]